MRYSVILADPPWRFTVWSAKGTGRSADQHYPTMSMEEIKSLPVDVLAADNCVLFLWACWPMIDQALDVIRAWGFKYKTRAFTWAKLTPSGLSFHFGMGYYTRANDEPCLLATPGRMPVADHGVPSLLVSPMREHSRKPDEQYGLIERLYPQGPYLELFARRKRDGWDSWGNEIASDISLAEIRRDAS